MKKNVQKLIVFPLILLMMIAWFFSGWPQIWQKPAIPPKIEEVKAAEVTIDASIFDATDEYSPSPNVVFISDQVGYVFYVDGSSDVVYSKTTNGGTTWGAAVVLSPDKTWADVAVWYDQWTPGSNGTKIHIVAAEAGTDDIWYNYLDTSNGTLRGWVAVILGATFTPATSGGPSITKSTDGNLFILGFTNTFGKISKSINGGDTWTDTAIATGIDDADEGQLLPLSGGDVLLILQDLSTNTAQSKVYDEGTDTWDTSWTSIDTWVENTAYACTWGASFYKSTDDIYLAGNTKPDGGTGYPLKAYKFTESSRSWSTLANIAAVAEALQVTMAVDENNGDLYTVYIRGGSAGATTNVYYKKSTNGGTSWGDEIELNISAADDYRYVRTNLTSNERIYAVWYDDDDNDLFGNTVADIAPPVIVTVGTEGLQVATTTIPSTNFYVGGAFTFVSNGSQTVSSITITETGTVNANLNLSNVDLYYETTATCSYEGTETLFGTATSFNTSEKATVTGTMTVGTSQVCIYVILDVSSGAAAGETVEIEITDPSTEITISAGIVSPTIPVAIAGTTTLQVPVVPPATWRANENTTTTAAVGENIRLRIALANTAGSTAIDYDYRLEYSSKVGDICGDDESWITMPIVALDEHFEMTTSDYFTNGDPTTARLSNPEEYTFLTGRMVANPSNSSGNLTLPVENYTEIEFIFQVKSNASGSYCFQITKAGIVLDEYLNYPELEISS